MEDYNNNDDYNYNYNQQENESYSNPYNQFYDMKKGDKPIWAAVTSFVISIINVISCCCCGYVTIIASLVFGIVSLANKWRGKGLAIAGVTISSICLVVTIATQVFLGGLSACITEVISTTPKYYEDYKETGEIPEELEKFNNDEYDWYWKMTGNDDFAEFYDQWMTMYGTIAENSQYSEGIESSDAVIDDDDFFNSDDFFNDDDFYGDESSEPEFGETPVDL